MGIVRVGARRASFDPTSGAGRRLGFPATRLACLTASVYGARRLARAVVSGLVLALLLTASAEAGGRKAKKFYNQGRRAELVKDYDQALELYEQAFAENPVDQRYELAARRMRFVAGQAHVDRGHRLRRQGQLEEALTEFQRALEIDPASSVAAQESKRTVEMIERREKLKGDPKADEETIGVGPLERERLARQAKVARLKGLPELKPISTQLINLTIPKQESKVVFETICKLAGINVLFDPDYDEKEISIEIQNATLEDALDYVSLLSKSFWKTISPNAVFVTNDNTNKRREYQEEVVRTFYLANAATPQEIQEVATAIRGLTEIRRLFPVNSMNALILRGPADKIALAEKVINDIDKARPEVIIDVLVLETSKTRNRELGVTPVSGGANGLSLPVTYTGGAAAGGEGSGGGVALSGLRKLSSGDWSTVLPGAQLTALMTRSDTRLLQSPRLRAADNFQASLRIGDRIPIATGSFSGGLGSGVGGISPLVNTQFTYTDVGVNVDLTPKIHNDSEVSMHIEIEISNVRDFVDIGGISQPVIGQRKVTHDVRIRDGEASILGGLMQSQTFITKSGVPFLGSIPLIGRFFSSKDVQLSENEILIVLVPRIVRVPEINSVNLKAVASGVEQVYRVRYERESNDVPALPEVGAHAPSQAETEATEVAEAAPVAPSPVPPPSAPGVPTAPESTEPEEPEEVEVAEAEPAATPAAPEQPSAAPSFSFAPAEPVVAVGEQLEIGVSVANVKQLFGIPMRFGYNPKLLRLVDIQRGTFLQGDGQDLIFSKNIRHKVGLAAVNISRFPGTGGVDGGGLLVKLVFEGVASGRSDVKVTPTGARDAESKRMKIAAGQVSVRVR